MKSQDGIPTDRGKSSWPGVWKWMIVLAHGVCQSVILAVVQNFALLFGNLFLRLDLTITEVGLLLNCNAAVGSLFALAGGWTLGRLGHSRTAALGGVLLAVGVACGGQASTFGQLFCWYSLLSSLGAGLVLCGTGAAVNAVFGGGEDRQRALVAAAVGAGIVPVAAPLVVSTLLEWYDVPGAALVCAAACLHCVAAALLLRPVSLLALVGNVSTKEDAANKKTEPTVRRGTIVPVMKIDAPEEEVKQAGSRRSSGMSSGPQRRGTPGWWARQSMGSIYAGTNSRIYDSRPFQLAGDNASRRSSRSSSFGLEPPPPGGHDSTDAHPKKLGVPGSGQKAGERRGSGLSVGSRLSQRLSIGSVHSTGSALAVVVDEDEEQDVPHSKESKNQRRSTATSVVSNSLEVPGEPAPGSRRSSAASTRSTGRGRQGGWWGRLSVGSMYSVGSSRIYDSRALTIAATDDDYPPSAASSQSELSQREGSTNSSLQIPSAARLNARRQSEDSRMGRRLKGGSSGKLDMAKPNERTRQMSVSSVRSAASSTTGYMTAAQSLRSSGSQGSGLWWSTLSLASTHSAEQASAIQEAEERADPPGVTSKLLGDGIEDMATPETPPDRRRGSWASTLGGPNNATWGVSYNSVLVEPTSQSPIDHPTKDSSTPEETLQLGESRDILPTDPASHSPSDTFTKDSITPESTLDTEVISNALPSDSKAQPYLESHINNSTTIEYIVEDLDQKFPSVVEPATVSENTLAVNMLASPEDTSDLGSSDGEDNEDNNKEPEVATKESIYSAGGGDKGQSGTSSVPFCPLGTSSASTAPPEKILVSPGDLIVNVEVSENVTNVGNYSTKENKEPLIAERNDNATASGKVENNDEGNNLLISKIPTTEVPIIDAENPGTEIDRREDLLDGKPDIGVSSSSALTNKTFDDRDELSCNADYEIAPQIKTGGEIIDIDNNKCVGNNIDTNIDTAVDEHTSLLAENKQVIRSEPGKPTVNNASKPSERYSIIVSLEDGAVEGGRRPLGGGLYSVDMRSVRSCRRACLLLGLAVAHCADVNHAFFTPLLLAACSHVPLAMCTMAAADLAARMLVTVALDGFTVPRKFVCLAGLALLVVSRSVLGMFTELGSVILACVFVGVSRGVKEVYFPAVMVTDDVWSTLCLRMLSQGVVFLTLGPLIGYMKDWSGNFGSSVIAINIATVVAMLLCVVENLSPEK